MDVKQAIETRRSVKKYDTGYKLGDAELKELFRLATLSPSSFNLQHWRFVVVRDAENKKAIRALSWDQALVSECSALVVVCANLKACQDAPRIFADTPEAVQKMMLPMIRGFYEGKDQIQRDEALRSASLAAMTLMLAATDMGLASCPLIGFDPVGVGKAIHLDADHIPVMMVTIGKQIGDMRPREYRHPLDEVVKLETIDGAGLA